MKQKNKLTKAAAYDAMIEARRRGGKATGKRKARSSAQARKAVKARWAKVKQPPKNRNNLALS